MRTIIAGSRTLTEPDVLSALAQCPWTPTVVLSGCARGPDTWGARWAQRHQIPVEYYPANWGLYGKQAGFRRNQQMGDRAEALVAVWDGHSHGTLHMIDYARGRGLKVFVWTKRSPTRL